MSQPVITLRQGHLSDRQGNLAYPVSSDQTRHTRLPFSAPCIQPLAQTSIAERMALEAHPLGKCHSKPINTRKSLRVLPSSNDCRRSARLPVSGRDRAAAKGASRRNPKLNSQNKRSTPSLPPSLIILPILQLHSSTKSLGNTLRLRHGPFPEISLFLLARARSSGWFRAPDPRMARPAFFLAFQNTSARYASFTPLNAIIPEGCVGDLC